MSYDNVKLDKDYSFLGNMSCNLDTYEINIHFQMQKLIPDPIFVSGAFGVKLDLIDFIVYGLVHETLHLVFEKHGLNPDLVDGKLMLWVLQYVLNNPVPIQTSLRRSYGTL